VLAPEPLVPLAPVESVAPVPLAAAVVPLAVVPPPLPLPLVPALLCWLEPELDGDCGPPESPLHAVPATARHRRRPGARYLTDMGNSLQDYNAPTDR
jgi:hypothetical protein